jgi:hypothetical protein
MSTIRILNTTIAQMMYLLHMMSSFSRRTNSRHCEQRVHARVALDSGDRSISVSAAADGTRAISASSWQEKTA